MLVTLHGIYPPCIYKCRLQQVALTLIIICIHGHPALTLTRVLTLIVILALTPTLTLTLIPNLISTLIPTLIITLAPTLRLQPTRAGHVTTQFLAKWAL